MKKRFSEEQIVGILREARSGQKTVEQISRGTHALIARSPAINAGDNSLIPGGVTID